METDDTKFEPLQDGAQSSEQPREQWNRNVIISLVLTDVNGFADSIWTGTVRPTRFGLLSSKAALPAWVTYGGCQVLVAVISDLAGGQDAPHSNTKVLTDPAPVSDEMGTGGSRGGGARRGNAALGAPDWVFGRQTRPWSW